MLNERPLNVPKIKARMALLEIRGEALAKDLKKSLSTVSKMWRSKQLPKRDPLVTLNRLAKALRVKRPGSLLMPKSRAA